MYRSPEIMDTWNNEPIGPPVDCWALGCILYALVTLRHPFPEGELGLGIFVQLCDIFLLFNSTFVLITEKKEY